MTPIPPQALEAYSKAGTFAGPGLEPRTAGDGNFADLLKNAANEVVDTLQHSEAESAAGVAGTGNLTEVVTAISNAEAVLQTVVAVRDRVIQAYQDIMKMPI